MLSLKYEYVQSDSRPGITHIVAIVDARPVQCSCEDWLYNMLRLDIEFYVCKHMARLAGTYRTKKSLAALPVTSPVLTGG